MTSKKILGVCIVGCGDLGTKHAERWNTLSNAQVVSVVDIKPERAEALARICNLDVWHTDHRSAIEHDGVDVVSVCVPTGLHPEITIFAAEHGKHILCEKPIALTVEDAEAMIEAAQHNNVKLTVGFMRRYSPVLPVIKDWLATENGGKPVLYHATDFREIRPKREMHDTYANGGPIIDMGVHLFDLWRYIFDSTPAEVFAQGFKLAQNRTELKHINDIAYDTATIVVRYQSGDVGNFVVTWGLPPGVVPPGKPDQILGTIGQAQIGYSMDNQSLEIMREGGALETVASSQEDMYQRQITTFAQSILDHQVPHVTGEDGKNALRVALAALESLKSNQLIKL